jgi:hypothetical protein
MLSKSALLYCYRLDFLHTDFPAGASDEQTRFPSPLVFPQNRSQVQATPENTARTFVIPENFRAHF